MTNNSKKFKEAFESFHILSIHDAINSATQNKNCSYYLELFECGKYRTSYKSEVDSECGSECLTIKIPPLLYGESSEDLETKFYSDRIEEMTDLISVIRLSFDKACKDYDNT